MDSLVADIRTEFLYYRNVYNAKSETVTTTRILLPCDELDAEALGVALTYVKAICEGSSTAVEEVVLFVPTKQQVKHTGLATALGDRVSRRLQDGHSVNLPFGVPMRLETVKTLRWLGKSSVVVCAYADQKMLDQIDAQAKLTGVVAIPYAPGVLDQWQRTWSAHTHGSPQQSQATPLIVDPVVEQALVSLTSSINLSHSVLHPRDKEHAERTLKILRIKGHVEDPENVRAWTVRNGWQPSAADELKKLASKIASLKSRPRVERPEDVDRLYQYWKGKVSDSRS